MPLPADLELSAGSGASGTLTWFPRVDRTEREFAAERRLTIEWGTRQ